MIVRRNTINAALQATTDDDTRYFLSSIQLDPLQHTASATDGSIALIVKDSEPIPDDEFPLIPGANFHADPPAPFMVAADVLRGMVATMPKRATVPVLGALRAAQDADPASIVVAATDLSAHRVATFQPDAAQRFHDLARVMPAADRRELGVTIAIDVLERLIKAAKALDPSSKRPIPTIHFGFPLDARDRAKIPGTEATETTPATPDRPGDVISAIRVTITNPASGLRIDGAAMPCRVG
jgi:hypothetical protein